MTGSWGAFVREFRQGGWRVLLASATGYGLGMTVLPYYTLGAFVGPLGASYGWSRSQVQGCMAMVVLATVVGAWGVGWATDRYGVRLVAAVSQVGLGIGLALLGLTPDHLWYWYGVWFLMALVGLGTSPITWTRSVAGWFNESRGLALALALCGSAISTLVLPTMTALIIEHHGWRSAYWTLAATLFVLGLPVTFWLMPKDKAVRDRSNAVGAPGVSGVTVREALGNYRFWLLALCLMTTGFAISGIIPNLVPMMVGRGIGPATAASFMGFLGFAIIVGRLITGALLDRLWAPIVGCLILPLPALSCIVLAHGTNDYLTVAGCVALLGLATGAEFDLAPYLVTRYFGMSRYSQIYALLWISFTLAAGLAPAIFGYCFDVTGSYNLTLYIGACFFLLSPLLLLGFGRYPALFVAGKPLDPALSPI
jgi:OFA family oxalate/formate antiporter-like MFS transporter